MKKEEFLIVLLETLKQRGVADDVAKRETEHVRTYLTESGMEELDISADEMADGIIGMLEDPSEDNTHPVAAVAVAVPADNAQGSVSDELNAAIAAIDAEKVAPSQTEPENTEEEDAEPAPLIPIAIDLSPEDLIEDGAEESNEMPAADEHEEQPDVSPESEKTEEESEEESNEQEFIIAPVIINADLDQNEPLVREDSTTGEESAAEEEESSEPEKSEDPTPESQPAEPYMADYGDEENDEIEEYIPYEKKKRMRKELSESSSANEWLYVLLLVITIPISVAIILIAFALYLGFWVALALLMIACIALLVVFVSAGAVVSLVGIVFGVVELITGLVPVGLYEIGLGVTVGAGVMFAGILLYNFAVRFIPFGMKLLAKLIRSGFRAVRSGYQSLKGAVAKI